ncbi:hypothetical protein L6R52_10560 [Myxococcota bacterium]|nr:hypothetical protein [Myxococcota bacterium]
MLETPELPLFSRFELLDPAPQSYRVLAHDRTVEFEGLPWRVAPDLSAYLPRTPLPEHGVVLRPAMGSEDPGVVSEYAAQDTFLGASSFIRVGGVPLWIHSPEEVRCECGQEMAHVASFGYETYGQPSIFPELPQAFFLGELALYFFVCASCVRVAVVSQPT